MSSEQEGQKEKGSSGSAAGALTPPTASPSPAGEQTMKFSAADQNTIQQIQNTIQTAPKTVSQPRSTVPISAPGSGPGRSMSSPITNEVGPQTLATGLSIQDLTGERLLLSAPRTESHGRQCPTLNGIPLLTKIGQGGMGAVYYGIHPRLRSEVAVKVLPFHLAEQDPGMIRRFFREAQIAAQVRSPHLVNVMDVNEEAGLFFLVMEYVSGGTAGHYMKSLLEKGAPGLSELDALEVGIASTEGLWAAHTNNIVHRDIKPENIMLPYQTKTSTEYDLARAKLMDLGLARNEDSQQSLTGAQAAMGTPGYMAPEQAMDAKSADKRSDVFSMGCTLYALMTGKPPFKGETIMKVLMATMHEPHEPIIKVRGDISPAINEVLEKCLTKKQDNRYPDARHLLGALQDCRRLLTGGGAAGGSVAGARTFVYGTGPGAVAAGGERTVVGGAATPTPAPSPAPAKKSKGMLYVGAAAAVLVLGAVGVYYAKVKPTTTAAVPPPGPGGDKPPVDPDVVQRLTKRHANLIAQAKTHIANSDPDEAKFTLELAQGLGLADEATRKAEKEVESGIAGIFKKKEFDTKIKEAELLETKGDLQKAAMRLNDAMALLAPEDPAAKKAQARLDGIQKKINTAKKRKTDEAVLAEARACSKEKPELAAVKVADILKAYADSNDELHKDAAKLEIELKDAMAERQRKDEYDKLIKDVEAAFKKEDYKLATDKALAAKNLIASRPEASSWLKQIGPKLDEADKQRINDEQRQQREKRIGDAVAAANSLLKQDKLDEAAASLKTALELAPEHEGAVAVQKLVQQALNDRQQKEDQQRNVRKFQELVDLAGRLAAADSTADLDDAAQKVAEARKLFPQDKAKLDAADSVDKKIAAQRDVLKARADYEKLLTDAKDARTAGNLDDAKKLIETALLSPQKDTRALTLRTNIDGEIEERKKAAEATANKDAEYNKLVSSGDSLDKDGDNLKPDAFDEKIGRFNLALRDFAAAKLLKSDGIAAKRETEVRRKLEQVKAAKAAKAQKAAEEAALAQKRKDFDAQIALADGAAKKGDLDGALGYLDSAKAILADEAAAKVLATKRQDIAARQAQADTAVRAAFGQVLEPLKKSPVDLAAAMVSAQKASQEYPGRFAAVLDALQKMQSADAQIKQAAAAAAVKLADFSKNKKLQDRKELQQFQAARDRLEGLVAAAASQLVAVAFKDSAALLQSLERDQKQAGDELARLAPELERMGRESSKPEPVEARVPDRQPKPAKRGSVGETNVFDE